MKDTKRIKTKIVIKVIFIKNKNQEKTKLKEGGFFFKKSYFVESDYVFHAPNKLDEIYFN